MQNYRTSRTLREIWNGASLQVVVRERSVSFGDPTEYINYFAVKRPPYALRSILLGKSVTYDTVRKCYFLDPAELEHLPLNYAEPFVPTNLVPIAIIHRLIPCPPHQKRVDVAWRNGKWMKYLEAHRGEWKEC